MATPIVAGAVALLRSHDTGITNEEIFSRLIQASNKGGVLPSKGGVLRIRDAITDQLTPKLHYQSYVLVDTLASNPGDGDFNADAGEHIGISFSVKNSGGLTEGVYAKLSLGEFEDPTVATVLTDSINLGNIGIYGTLGHTDNPLILSINPSVVHDRDIILAYELGAINTEQKVVGELIIRVTNAEELSGLLTNELTLTADKQWVVQNSFRITDTGVLNLDPGTKLILENDIVNNGIINANGIRTNPVEITGSKGIQEGQREVDGSPGEPIGCFNFKYTNISDLSSGTENNEQFSARKIVLNHVNVTDFYGAARLFSALDTIQIYNSSFRFIKTFMPLFGSSFLTVEESNFESIENTSLASFNVFTNNNFSRIGGAESTRGLFVLDQSYDLFENNNFLGNPNDQSYPLLTTGFSNGNVENNYWGTIDSLKITEYLYDFWDNAQLIDADFSPFLSKPSEDAHGIVWKVEINGIDPQDERLDPVGAEQLKFEVHFNKPMDVLYTPFLTFGLREPRTQNQVTTNASWSADSTVWTAFYDVNFRTGDGLNTIRVSGARDTEGFEIPVEDNLRFQFIIQSTAGLSTSLAAISKIGAVELSWDKLENDDVLGYNVYRFSSFVENEETKYTDTLRVNEALVLEGTYNDLTGDPGTDYYYLLTSLDANFSEGDFSNAVQATPLAGSAITLSGDLSFAETEVGSTSTKTFTISNSGNSDLTVTSVSYPSGFSGDWSAGTVTAGGSQQVNVVFAPTEAITYSGNIEVASDAHSGDNTIAVSGTGTDGVVTSIEPKEVFIVTVYPNPTKDYLFLQLNASYIGRDLSFHIVDLTGKIHILNNLKLSSESLTIDVRPLRAPWECRHACPSLICVFVPTYPLCQILPSFLNDSPGLQYQL